MRRSGALISLILMVATLAGHGVLANPSPQATDRAQLFQALLQLQARDLDGTRWSHHRLQGRITLVDFWATWCAPCVRELPYLKRARGLYGDRFEILGISLDTMDRNGLRRWLARQDVQWPQVQAAKGYHDPLAAAFGIERLPTNLLLDRKGRLRAVNVRGPALFAEIDKLLAEASRQGPD